VPDLWTDLLGCLQLRGRDSEQPDVVVFEGANQQLNYHRLFGGQLLAQFIRAASAVCPDKAVKSLHAVFAKEGRADDPVQYQVTRQHEGRSFATLTITARQPRGVLATSSVSMHVAEDGPAHQSTEAILPLLDEKHRAELDLIPWETRCADDLNASSAGPPRLEVWMRTPAVDAAFAPRRPPTPPTSPSSEPRFVPSRVSINAATARRSPRPSPPTPSGFTGHSAPIAGCCCVSTVPCWHTAAALVAVASYGQEALLRFRDAGDRVNG
jgi:Thioesterase-like superfamily